MCGDKSVIVLQESNITDNKRIDIVERPSLFQQI